MGDIAELVDVESIAEKLEYLYGTKQEIADAINEVGESQGVSITSADTFRSYADKIRSLGTAEIGKISVRTTPLYDGEIGTYQKFEAPEGKVWKEVYVHIDAWSAVTQDVDPLIISENGYYDINDMSASKFAFSEVQNPSGNPKEKHYYEKYQNQFIPSEDTSVVEGKTYYVKDKEKEYEVASSFIINVQRNSAAPFTCEFLDEDDNVIETHNDIPYGGWCQFQGEIPVSKTGLAFQGWNPAPNNIQSNRKCHAVYYTPRKSSEEWGQSWAEIVVDHGANMPIGAWKTLPLKDNKVTINGVDINIPPIEMVKVYNGEDVSTSSFLSKDLVYFGDYCEDGNDCLPEYWTGHADFSEEAVYNHEVNGQKFHTCNEFLLALFDLLPDYIRQFVVPVTKYSTTTLCPGCSDYSRMTAMQQYMWIPSARELGATEIIRPSLIFGNVNIVADRGPIYSDAFPDQESRIKRYGGSVVNHYRCREMLAFSPSYGMMAAGVLANGSWFNQAFHKHSAVGFCL